MVEINFVSLPALQTLQLESKSHAMTAATCVTLTIELKIQLRWTRSWSSQHSCTSNYVESLLCRSHIINTRTLQYQKLHTIERYSPRVSPAVGYNLHTSFTRHAGVATADKAPETCILFAQKFPLKIIQTHCIAVLIGLTTFIAITLHKLLQIVHVHFNYSR